MKTSDNANITPTGIIEARFYDQTALSGLEQAYNRILVRMTKTGPKWLTKRLRRRLVDLYRFGPLKLVEERHNVICNAGFNAITKLLTGDVTYTGEINKAILGSGVGSAAASDTQLITEEYRNDIASGTDDSNIAYLTALFTEAETSGTFTEFGNCIDGTGTENTGQLWSHVTGLNWVKDTSTALVVSCKYTFASVAA